jgi:hypothetical protein
MGDCRWRREGSQNLADQVRAQLASQARGGRWVTLFGASQMELGQTRFNGRDSFDLLLYELKQLESFAGRCGLPFA